MLCSVYAAESLLIIYHLPHMVHPCVPTYRPAYPVSVRGFPFRLFAGIYHPVYASSISYTPILARRRYTAAIPQKPNARNDEFPSLIIPHVGYL